METHTGYRLLDGKKLSKDIKEEVRQEVERWKLAGNRAPLLVALLVGQDPASQTYVSSKIKACEKVGFHSSEFYFDESVSEEELLSQLDELNADDGVDGILVQLPLPAHISQYKVIERIRPDKDVDGFHPVNIGRMAKGLPAPLPATPAGIMEMLGRYQIETTGKNAVVVGNSQIVGSPISILLARDEVPGRATVTVCHIHTKDLAWHTRQADILIVATGVTHLIKADMVKEGAVVIDVGITRVPDPNTPKGYRITGDVDFENVAPKCSFITPVPGGVGPMTIAMLLKNTLELYIKRQGEKG